MRTPYPPAGRPLGNERGVAMLTILMLILILTVIGLASITSTSLDIKIAGGERMRASSLTAAEACMSSAVQIIQQTLQASALPSTLTVNGANPRIVTTTPIEAEILGQSDNNPDTADPSATGVAANAVLSIPSAASPVFTVNMDIDRLYSKAKAGGSLQFAAGYEGSAAGAAGGGIEIFYRIDCYASSMSGLTTKGRITGVYACVATGDSCQRKI